MKKSFFTTLFVSTTIVCCAQIGINTENPRYDLDVNGTFAMRKELKVNGGGTPDNPGAANQILVSQGPTLPPKWDNSITIPVASGYLLTFSQLKTDEKGTQIAHNQRFEGKITEGELMGSNWYHISGLDMEFEITRSLRNNFVFLNMQTVIQSDINRDFHLRENLVENPGDLSDQTFFACGIFLNDKLMCARTGNVEGVHGPSISFLLLHTLSGLNRGSYKLKVAFQRRESPLPAYQNANLYIGKGVNLPPTSGAGLISSTNSNNFMNKSNLMVDVYEFF